LGVHGDAGQRERLQVATGGLHRHLELGGHLRRGDPSAGLEEEQRRHQSIRSHEEIFAPNLVRG
jgi:hypothetical protein